MKNEMLVTKRNQPHGNVNRLITPEVRRHIRELKRGLVQCGYPLLDHLGYLDTVVAALGIAERSAECLLADDPFEAWDKLLEKDEWDEPCDTTEKKGAKTAAVPNVKRMITQPMRQQLVEAIKRLDEYHGCLTELLVNLSKLESFDTAWGFAKDLQSNRPLETAEARKKRREAEAEAQDDLDGL